MRIRTLAPSHIAVAALALVCMAATTAPPGRITGIGGVFLKSPNPKALAAWYRDVLGLDIASWGGAMLKTTAPGYPQVVVWNAFPEDTTYFDPGKREFMVNFGVDDLDAIIARLTAHHVQILKRDDSDPNGRFAWILDPDGTKLELWQPKHP